MLEQMRFSNSSIPVTTVLNDINTVAFGGLDLQPSYQRGYVWKDDFKDKLIYSVIKNYPTGNISVRVLNAPNAKGARSEVVDGQQRLTTLFLLLTYLKDSSINSNSLSFEAREKSNRTLKYLFDMKRKVEEDPLYSSEIITGYKVISDYFEAIDEKEREDFKIKFVEKLKNILIIRTLAIEVSP